MTWQAKTPQIDKIVDRRHWIVDQCRGKEVLDIGFVADPQLVKKPKHDIPLHDQLIKVVKSYIGMDKKIPKNKYFPNINYYYLEHNIETYPLNNVKIYHLKSMDNLDVIILAEVLEHLSNPGKALDNIKNVMKENTKFLISVPNCFHERVQEELKFGTEQVHKDHVAWYSPCTLTTLLTRHGFKIDQLLGYAPNWNNCPRKRFFQDIWRVNHNYLRMPGMIAECSI
jgi:SAM-dependent methyltransferase|tara:strand:+ start:1362 stop:2039 length:678 start_codon:yes stop_codon:yes gene_type:complete